MESANGQYFCHSFQADVIDNFRSLREQSEGFDVILGSSSPDSSNMIIMQAHKMMIAASSPLLYNVLETNEKLEHPASPFIYLGEVSQKDITYILEYVYNGEVTIPSEDISSFTTAAQQLQIRGIAQLQAENMPTFNDGIYPSPLPNSNTGPYNNEAIHKQIMANTFGMHNNYLTTPILNGKPKPAKRPKMEKLPKIKNGLNKSVNVTAKGAKPTEKPVVDEKYKGLAAEKFKEWKEQHSVSDGVKFDCHKCPEIKSFTAASSLLRHYKQNHEAVCKSCKMPFCDEQTMEAHYKATHEYSCNLCEQVFTAPSSVQRHQKKNHGL